MLSEWQKLWLLGAQPFEERRRFARLCRRHPHPSSATRPCLAAPSWSVRLRSPRLGLLSLLAYPATADRPLPRCWWSRMWFCLAHSLIENHPPYSAQSGPRQRGAGSGCPTRRRIN